MTNEPAPAGDASAAIPRLRTQGGARDTAGSYVKWVDEYSSEGFEGLAATLERLLDQAAAAQPDTCAYVLG